MKTFVTTPFLSPLAALGAAALLAVQAFGAPQIGDEDYVSAVSAPKEERTHYAVSLVFSYMALADGKTTRGSAYLGNITELELDNAFMVMPELAYDFSENVRLALSYSSIKAGTKNWNNHFGDGAAKLRGPLVRLDFRYPAYDGKLIPHAGAGAIFYNSSFDEDTSWKLGYSNYEAWRGSGFSSRTAFGKFRSIKIDNIVAPLVSLGVAYRPHPNWELDLSYVYTFCEPDCKFGYVNGKGVFGEMASGSFDFSSHGAALTLSYLF